MSETNTEAKVMLYRAMAGEPTGGITWPSDPPATIEALVASISTKVLAAINADYAFFRFIADRTVNRIATYAIQAAIVVHGEPIRLFLEAFVAAMGNGLSVEASKTLKNLIAILDTPTSSMHPAITDSSLTRIS